MKKTLLGLMIALFLIGAVITTIAIVNLNKNEGSEQSDPSGESKNPQIEFTSSDNSTSSETISTEWLSDVETLDGEFATTAIKDLRFYACTTGGITVKSWKFTNTDTKQTISDGLDFYAMDSQNLLDESGYLTDKNQIIISDDWFAAQISKADGAKNFELSVTYGGMKNYLKNDNDGRIGITFKNKSGESLYFDLVENNEVYYSARLLGAVEHEKGFTSQPVGDEITLKLKRNGNKYVMSCGSQEWNFIINSPDSSTTSTTSETPIWTPPFKK